MMDLGNDSQISNQTPLYVSKRAFKNLWQQYSIYPDRIELQCWVVFHTLKIPLHDIADVMVRTPWPGKEPSPVKGLDIFRAVKNDLSDLYRHVLITRKSGIFKYICFTPDNPDEFADIIKMLKDYEAPQN
jgi:hypothetical protein